MGRRKPEPNGHSGNVITYSRRTSQRRADKQFELLAQMPSHRSLRLKPVGDVWSACATDAYRALAIREGFAFTWFRIGPHDEYVRLLNG